MFNFLLLQVFFIPWLQWRAMNTASIWIVTTQFWITFALQTTISFCKYNINFIFLNVCFIGSSWLCWLEWRRKWWNRTTWTACTGLLAECFDNLLKCIRNSMISLFFLEKLFLFPTYRWRSSWKWFHKNHISMLEFVVINCLWSARCQFILVVTFTIHSKIEIIQLKCIMNWFIELSNRCSWEYLNTFRTFGTLNTK